MRLRKIKLSGFKSFVDPVTIPVSANLVGVVGPNGCGKSNIIDAVRWVMGESSAKNLRGDSMSDVIFSGSSTRKPVGRAAVELVFDNSEGRAPGPYATHAEISIRREAGRDGESEYFLNRVRCRRRDIMDLFLGTGVGARAYAIIEQGTVTRIIESRPEDLRTLFDEAAGVSKYKERRRDTENRMRHTRENLDRVDDVRQELEGQLARLQRQSKAAIRYQELKQEERRLRGELIAVRLRETDLLISEQADLLAKKETDLEEALAHQRAAEAALERLRAEEIEARERAHELDARVRAIGAEVARLEQEIGHIRTEREQRLKDRDLIDRDLRQIEETLAQDAAARAALQENLEDRVLAAKTAGRVRDAASARLREAEHASAQWREGWTRFTAEAADAEKHLAIESARMLDLERQSAELSQRIARLEQEAQTVEEGLRDDGSVLRREVTEQDRLCEALALKLQELDEASRACRAQEQELQGRISGLRGEIQTAEARLASLEELQAAARGGRSGEFDVWLAAHAGRERLADVLRVEPGWEKAVERVLGADLGAVITNDLAQIAAEGAAAGVRAVVAFAAGDGRVRDVPEGLLGRISTAVDLEGLLAGVHVADSVDEALVRRSTLGPGESVITRDGLWCGRNWIRFPSADPGLLVRGREMESLRTGARTLRGELESLESLLSGAQGQHAGIEDQREAGRGRLAELNRERANRHSVLGQNEARLTQLVARRDQLAGERADAHERLEGLRGGIEQARARVSGAREQVASRQRERADLEATGATIEQEAIAARAHDRAAAAGMHEIEVEQERMQSELRSISGSIERLSAQRDVLAARRRDLEEVLAAASPEGELRARIDQALAERVGAEAIARAAGTQLGEIEGRRQAEDQVRQREVQHAAAVRTEVEEVRLRQRELSTKREGLCGQTRELGMDPVSFVPEVPDEAGASAMRTVDMIEGEIGSVVSRVERLGPINLAAISEHEEHAKRKEFLDSQHADLSQALTSLEEAIHKIDRETRMRFRETFDRVNAGFQSFFPRLFGGGQAHLELLGDDMLETGVTVIARPPGKRNTTIHLLSGGEKALTAVALIFAIFELNPAPFCLLDEVDAPLDDANVERYAQTLRAMSERTQLIYVTHNKVSMETADLLLGVTMSEPGVSRLVSVDVEQAVEMVTKTRQAGA
ncbi:MAG: chromosome segregation protein SMC [Acidiferrobacteraceae bacterium]